MPKKIENVSNVNQLTGLVQKSQVVVGKWGGRNYRLTDEFSSESFTTRDIIYTLNVLSRPDNDSLNECKKQIKNLNKNSTEDFENALAKENVFIWLLGKIQQIFDNLFFNIDESLDKISTDYTYSECLYESETWNIESMRKEISLYIQELLKTKVKMDQNYKARYSEMVLKNIDTILNDKNFIKSPRQYVHDLKKEIVKDTEEGWNSPQLDALEFFIKKFGF